MGYPPSICYDLQRLCCTIVCSFVIIIGIFYTHMGMKENSTKYLYYIGLPAFFLGWILMIINLSLNRILEHTGKYFYKIEFDKNRFINLGLPAGLVAVCAVIPLILHKLGINDYGSIPIVLFTAAWILFAYKISNADTLLIYTRSAQAYGGIILILASTLLMEYKNKFKYSKKSSKAEDHCIQAEMIISSLGFVGLSGAIAQT